MTDFRLRPNDDTAVKRTHQSAHGEKAKPSQQLIDIIQAHRSLPPEVDDDLEAALDSLTEQVEVDAVDAFDDAEFVVAEIFLSERRKKLKFDHLVSIL